MNKSMGFHQFMFLLTFFMVFAMSSRVPLDSDMWWHLRAGKEMVSQGRILTKDIFSYTRLGEEWINHSWLSQVILYLTFHWGGYIGLAFFVSILAALSMIALYPQMSGHPLIRGSTIIFASIVAAMLWSPRPQMFSLVFLGLTSLLLYQFKYRKRNYLWLLPIVFVFWSNLHGGYVLGFLFISATTLGEMLNKILLTNYSEQISWKNIGQIVFCTITCVLCVVINPNGFKMWMVPVTTINVNVLQESISEWASPDFHHIEQQTFIWLLLAVFLSIGFSAKRLEGSDGINLSLFAYLALLARRNFAPFAIVVAPILTRYLDEVLKHWFSRIQESPRAQGLRLIFAPSKFSLLVEPTTRTFINMVILSIVAGISFLKLYWVTTPALVLNYERKIFPTEAVEWIRVNRPQGNMFNSYNWGGYLEWNLPEYPVFVDGRTDLFGDQLLNEYLDAINAKYGWSQIMDKYLVGFILIEGDSPLSETLSTSKGWKRVYKDNLAVIFTRSPVY